MSYQILHDKNSSYQNFYRVRSDKRNFYRVRSDKILHDKNSWSASYQILHDKNSTITGVVIGTIQIPKTLLESACELCFITLSNGQEDFKSEFYFHLQHSDGFFGHLRALITI